MVAVPLGQSTYRRRGARTAEVTMTNVMLEKGDPTNQVDNLVWFQRPALVSFAVVGTGPIRGIFRRFGVLGSVYLVVSGTELYKVTAAGIATLIGTIPGTDIVNIDGSATKAIIVASGTAYATDGSTITAVVMPGGEQISSVVYISSYFILTVLASQHFFWLAPGDVNPDPLNFASFESSSDNIIAAVRLLDEVWFFGESTTEIYNLTGDLNLPFQPIAGRLYEKGCANKSSIAILDNTLFWIGNDLSAYRADTVPKRISDHSMEERLRLAGPTDLRAWAIALDGHSLYCVRVGTLGSFIFDIENPNWGRWRSYGQETWRAHLGTQIMGDVVVAGDDTTGDLWRLDTTISNDNGSPLERELTGGITVLGAPQKCMNFSIRVATGWADITGTATDPIISLRYSDDGGNLWSSWIEMPLGLQGQYLTQVVWRQLGQMMPPGRLFSIRCTDDCIFRVNFARLNEAI
jgi:hypothetical protein